MDAWTRIKVMYRAAWALGMLGERERAHQWIDEACEYRDSESRPWARQAEGVMRADLLQILGRDRLALQVADETISETGRGAISRAHVGPVARWVVRIGERHGRPDETLECLDQYLRGLPAYDLIDQAELVAARLRLERSRGMTWPEGEAKMESLLLRLPSAVRVQLERLGFGT